MDETLEFEDQAGQRPNTSPLIPQPLPLSWSTLDPKLTKAMVEAQKLATTVENDGHNKAQDYRYATQAAIACKAREALGGAGLAVSVIGWPAIVGNLITATFIIVHESGACSPTFEASMPVGQQREATKSVAAGLTILRKYVLAGVLNMGWHNPTEDIDADQPGSRGNQANMPDRNRGQVQRTPRPPQVDPGEAERQRAVADGIRRATDKAREWAGRLADRFKVDREMIHQLATGLEEPMPRHPRTSVLAAIAQAGIAADHADAEGANNPSVGHSHIVEYIREGLGKELFWSHGKIMPAGESLDRRFPRPPAR